MKSLGGIGATDFTWRDEAGAMGRVVEFLPHEIHVFVSKRTHDGLGTFPCSTLVIPIDRLERINASESKTNVTIVHKKSVVWGALSKAPFAFSHIRCSSFESRDRLLETARRALAPGFTFARKDCRVRSLVAAITFLLFFCAAAWAFASYASDAALGKPLSYSGHYRWPMERIYPLLGTLGPTGVYAISCVVCFAILCWLAIYLQRPRIVLTLLRGKTAACQP